VTPALDTTPHVGEMASRRWSCSQCGTASPSAIEPTIDPRFGFGRCRACRQRTVHIADGALQAAPEAGANGSRSTGGQKEPAPGRPSSRAQQRFELIDMPFGLKQGEQP
jgi:hypothetical protein